MNEPNLTYMLVSMNLFIKISMNTFPQTFESSTYRDFETLFHFIKGLV